MMAVRRILSGCLVLPYFAFALQQFSASAAEVQSGFGTLKSATPSAAAATSATSAAVQCEPLTPAELAQRMRASNAPSFQLIFFSSWCSDCAVHLKKLENNKTILVGTFDKRERIEKIVAKLGLKNPCFMNSGLAERLGVKVVPAERSVTLEQLNSQGP